MNQLSFSYIISVDHGILNTVSTSGFLKMCLPSNVYTYLLYVYMCVCVMFKKNCVFNMFRAEKMAMNLPPENFWCQFYKAPWRFQPGPLLCEGVENSMIG